MTDADDEQNKRIREHLRALLPQLTEPEQDQAKAISPWPSVEDITKVDREEHGSLTIRGPKRPT